MFNASRCRCLAFRSFVRRARFSTGVNSLRARCKEDEVANISSGASMVAVDLDVGRADSKVAVAVLVMVDIVAFSCPTMMSNFKKRSKKKILLLVLEQSEHCKEHPVFHKSFPRLEIFRRAPS